MALTPGTRLGVYEVTAQIGEGGMGQVYRATDTRLNRDVAVKVLPDSFANDPDRLARFTREAQTLASLNHPNIAHIHGLEESGGVRALVMELVEGEDLSQRIARGAIPVDEALPIAKQIAEALEAAHEQGIIHRDLKPANIRIRDDGTVKVLDFGLARALDPSARPSPSVSRSPTITSPAMTQAGMILGTAAYMAPEQARGKPVDKRADIWAFGCVLYEMVTGARPFRGDDVTDTIASVVKDQPDFSRVPRLVERLIRRCLEKDPKRRLRDVGDAWDLLEGSAPAVARPAATAPRLLWIGAVALAAAAGAATVWLLESEPTVSPAVNRFAHALGELQNLGTRLAISRDGRRIAYTANGQIYLRVLDDLVARPVPGTAVSAAPASPFFSPDGESIAFFAQGRLLKVPVTGGTPVPLGNANANGGGSWGADGTIAFVQSGSIWRISAEGGAPELLVRAGEDELLADPCMLPGGRTLLYGVASVATSAETRWDDARIMVLPTGGTPKLIAQGGASARFVSTGHLVFAVRNSLWAMPFDATRLEKTGDAVSVVDDLGRLRQTSAAAYSVSDNGTLTFVPANQFERQLVWVDRQGREEGIAAEQRSYANPRLSPDGSKVALTTRDGGYDVWVWDLARRSLIQLTSDPSPNYTAAWLPDSKRLAFPVLTDASNEVHVRSADGSGQPDILAELTTPPTVRTYPVSVSADGHLAFTRYGAPAIGNVGVMSLVQRDAGLTLMENRPNDRNPVVSPDGRWLAFESNRTGQYEIYVSPFPDVKSGAQQVTTTGGTMPVWSGDQKHLYYWTMEGTIVTIMSLPVVSGSTFTWGQASPALRGPYERPTFDRQYDVWGDRFLMLKAARTGEAPPAIVIVENWFEELKKRVPGR